MSNVSREHDEYSPEMQWKLPAFSCALVAPNRALCSPLNHELRALLRDEQWNMVLRSHGSLVESRGHGPHL